MIDSIKEFLDPRSDKLAFLMYFLPMFTTGYMYYHEASSFYFWLLIISCIIIVIMESYHFAYMSIITQKDAKNMDKRIKVNKNVMKTVNSVKSIDKWYIIITGIWMVLYIYVIIRLFMFDDITTTLLGVFQAALYAFVTLKALFTLYLITRPEKKKNKNESQKRNTQRESNIQH